MKHTRTWAVALLILLCALTMVSCSKKQEAVATPAVEAVDVAIPVQAYTTKNDTITSYLRFTGDVAAVNTYDILSEVTGKVTNVLVGVGDAVAKDQVVMEVDASRPGSVFAANQVKAIGSGTVTAFYPVVGMTVAPGVALGQITDTQHVEITFNVVERYVSQVHVGQSAVVTFAAFGDELFEATVTKVSPTLDLASRSRKVTCTLNVPDERIIIGMFAKIQVQTNALTDQVVIPYQSVMTRDGVSYVFVVTGDVARRRDVTLGIRSNDLVQVTSGLVSGETIVTKGQTLLADGSLVSVSSRLGEIR